MCTALQGVRRSPSPGSRGGLPCNPLRRSQKVSAATALSATAFSRVKLRTATYFISGQPVQVSAEAQDLRQRESPRSSFRPKLRSTYPFRRFTSGVRTHDQIAELPQFDINLTTAGPSVMTNIAGKMRKTNGKSILMDVLAAASSARCLRLSRRVSD